MVQLNAQDKLQRRFYRLQLALSLLNTGLSLYLLIQHTRLKFGLQDSSSFCSLGRFADCDMVNSSPYSEFFGIPIASIGALFYFSLFLLAAIAPPKSKGFPFFQRIILVLGTLGFLVNFVFFDYIQIFILNSLCLFCATTLLLGLAPLFSVFRSQGRGC